MEKVKYNFVFYSDGSCNPNPNGVHSVGYFGYYYPQEQVLVKDQKGVKIKGLKANLRVTDLGIVTPKLEQENPNLYRHALDVSPKAYVIGCKNLGDGGTNYKAELQAIISVFKTIEKMKLEGLLKVGNILIKSDSVSCVNLVNRLANGETLDLSKYASSDLLEEIQNLLGFLKEENAIIIEHVYGHSSSLGNIIVDRLAYFAWLGNEEWNTQEKTVMIENKDDFFNPIELPDYLNFKNIYFVNGHNDKETNQPYIVMDYGKDEGIGDKTGDVCMGSLFVKEKSELVENLISSHLVDGEDGVVFSIDMNNLKDTLTKVLYNFGKEKVLTKNNRPKHLTLLEELPLVHTIRPAGLAKQLLTKFSFSFTILEMFQSKKGLKTIKGIPITDLFFRKKLKAKKDSYEILISQKESEIIIEEEGLKIPLVIGVDIPNRNYLKRFEKSKEIDIILYLIQVSPEVYTYCVLTRTLNEENEVIGIWENYFSNRIYK